MKSESINDLDFLSNDLRCRRCLSRRTFLVYQVMFFVACVDETRKKSIIDMSCTVSVAAQYTSQ